VDGQVRRINSLIADRVIYEIAGQLRALCGFDPWNAIAETNILRALLGVAHRGIRVAGSRQGGIAIDRDAIRRPIS
jgi:hypothetical protein